SNKEDGCIVYKFYSDLMNPRRFRLYEEWRDQAALDAHFASDHMAEFQKQLASFRVLDRNIKKFEVGETTSL
ncbi:MAG: putative quinol monooxygenase, partial [Pseudomonadota bacterium]